LQCPPFRCGRGGVRGKDGRRRQKSDSSHTEVPSLGIGNAIGVQPGYGEASVNSVQASKRVVALDPECRLQVSIPEISPLSEGRGESECGLGPARTQTSDTTNPSTKKGDGKDGVGTSRPASSSLKTVEVSVDSVVGPDRDTETNLELTWTKWKW
jgi:hypothetical protein